MRNGYLLFFLIALLIQAKVIGQNQTETLSPILPEEGLPFTLQIDEAPFQLPVGLQAYASAIYKGKWILLAGRTNGLHGFSNRGNNFPPQYQNTDIFVIDPTTGSSWRRPLSESGLSQSIIDTLSVTAAQSFQKGKMLYLVGGYGINTETGQMETKNTLTVIQLHRLLKWVVHGGKLGKKAISQTSDPLLQVTGGALFQADDHLPFLLCLGQNFAGLYTDGANGEYTMQIRRFWAQKEGKRVSILPFQDPVTYPDYRRRDLNVVPVLLDNQFAYIAFAGVFTLDGGVWTVPILIHPDGSSYELNSGSASSFKQAMNQYNCPVFGLYSTSLREMFAVFPGGISYEYFQNGVVMTDSLIPFINQMTTIKIDRKLAFTQYLMNGEYPLIASTGSNPGNPLLFGAEAQFFPKAGISLFENGVINYDKLPDLPVVIGYIVGGIMSTLADTNFASDSTSSPYIFTVTLQKR